ncbi:MAG: Hpt domain-containing protein [Caldilineaceae bacterium]
MTFPNDILRSDAIQWLGTSLGTDEPDILLDVLQTFLSDGAQLVERMQGALLEKDEQLLFRSAHTLKSSAAIIGAEQLSDACEVLERALRRNQSIDLNDAVATIVDAFSDATKALEVEVQKLEKNLV